MTEHAPAIRLVTGVLAAFCAGYLFATLAWGGFHGGGSTDFTVTLVFAGAATLGAMLLLAIVLPFGWLGGSVLVAAAMGGVAWDLIVGGFGWGSLFWLVLALVGSFGQVARD